MLELAQSERCDSTCNTEQRHEGPLDLLARCIADSLSVDHCAIEYTTASGQHGWAGSTHVCMVQQALVRSSMPPDTSDQEACLNVVTASPESGIGLLVERPLTLMSGTLIGRIWLAAEQSKRFTPLETDRLNDFSRVVSEMIYNESQISRLLDAQALAKTGMWSWRPSSNQFYGSSQFFEILGITEAKEGIVPFSLLRLIERNDRRAVEYAFTSTLKTHLPCSLELQIVGPSGRIRHVVATVRTDSDLAGRLVGAFGTVQDVTDSKRVEELGDQNRSLQESLRDAEELADKQRSFVAMVSHEFRTPLAIIDGNAHLLERAARRRKSDELPTIKLGKIRSSVKRLTGVLDDLLCAGRVETGKIQVQLESLDLSDLLHEVRANQLEIAPTRQIEMDLDQLEGPIDGDRKLLRHVFANIVSNALKYSPDCDRIWVSASQDDETVTVSVRDQGVGIPEDELAKVYDRFFRASTSAGIAGTGYGLHIVKNFVELHGGKILLQSREGQGSTFSIVLPRKEPLQTEA